MDGTAYQETIAQPARGVGARMEACAICGHFDDCVQFFQPWLAGRLSESVLEDSAWLRYENPVAHDGDCQYWRDLRRHRIWLAVGAYRQASRHYDCGIVGLAHHSLLGIRNHAGCLGYGCVPHASLGSRRLGHHPGALERA